MAQLLLMHSVISLGLWPTYPTLTIRPVQIDVAVKSNSVNQNPILARR